MNENTYTLQLTRLEICDLMLACTRIFCEAREEMQSPDCNEYRREKVLPGTVRKWEGLHDKVKRQLEAQDMGSAFDEVLERYRAGELTREEVKEELAYRAGFLFD